MATIEVKIPDIGDFQDVPIIEVHVKPGDAIEREASLVTLESEKATFDVPSPAAGTVRKLEVKVGDRVKEGSLVVVLEAADGAAAPPKPETKPEGKAEARTAAAPAPAAGAAAPRDAAQANGRAQAKAAAAPEAPPAPPPAPAGRTPTDAPAPVAVSTSVLATPPAGAEGGPARAAHASPSVRRFARELGVELARVEGSGPRGRITKEDVQRFVKEVVSGAPTAGGVAGLELPPWPKVDFARFGPIEAKPLSRIKRLSKANLARNWVMIPHVTQHDEADVTELEAFRVALNKEQEKEGVKVTLLAFVLKACVAALKKFPEFNASLDGDQLVVKRYWHLGFAADTPGGLVVPVVRNVDQKGVVEIARELSELAGKAREGKLAPGDMSGGTFSVSSLGGIGGTAFTPIINAPEVAILGVSRSATRPVWDGKSFQPRLLLPLSLSYDHRVVDGAAAARFTSFLAGLLGDMRRAML
jgi:pyruvate dehydrogenase E2 component (dihydrolipoamide acetyltransferase)